MAASVWSGYLTFGLSSMPVRLFSGARSSGISFHMLHRDDLTRIKQQLYCPNDNRVVERSEIVKGYEYRKDEYVVIEPEEIKKIEPKTAKTMEILEFVKENDVDPVYFESSYYMMPEEAGRRPYALLTKALEESEYVAIAKLTMHNREYTVFLRPHVGGLMLHTMYYEEEVRKVEGFGAPDVELKEAEVKVAHQLFFFSSRRRHTRCYRDWSSDVCSSDLRAQRRDDTCGECNIRVDLLLLYPALVAISIAGVVAALRSLIARHGRAP